jgi:hypothetical protein
MRAFTICLQGGMPGYEGAVNSAYTAGGQLRDSYLRRARRVIEACDRSGAAVILCCFYQRQDQWLRDEKAVEAAVTATATWVRENGFTNVLLEIANEFGHGGFDHPLIRTPEGEVKLIGLARRATPGLLIAASGLGDGAVPDKVAAASDFLLIHFNGVPLEAIPKRIEALRKFGKPIVCNEDDKTGADGARAAEISVAAGASWGLMLERHNQHFPFHFLGPADDPVIYARLKELTAPP